jgi:SAM-dependent methyltransferase
LDGRTIRDPKRYDRRYFDRWYRDPQHRVLTSTSLARRAAWVVATTEYVLQRPLRTVLDIGCGEGHWAPVLRRLRPRVQYTGVDPSPYVIARYGSRRHILRGTIQTLDELPLDTPFDLILCCAALNYLSPRVVTEGLALMAARLSGVAHIEIFSHGDPVDGDFRGWRWYPRAWVRRATLAAGLMPVGLHCYVGRDCAPDLCALESPG